MLIADQQIDVIHARSFDSQFGKNREFLDYQNTRLSSLRKDIK